MKFSSTIVAAFCVAAKAMTSAVVVVDGATCSSLNGPFCDGFGPIFAVAPQHARQNLDVSKEEIKAIQVAKSLKIDKVLKQYERQVATSDARVEDFLRSHGNIVKERLALQDIVDDETMSWMTSAFAFGSENDVFELLNEMNGDELKKLFETVLDEVVVSAERNLEEISSDATEGLRTTARQLKALEDYKTYTFQKLDKFQLANIRHKFAKHRSGELQQMFEQLVIADDAHERQVAFETAIFLFQLAHEEATTGPGGLSDGDWPCPNPSCCNVNFARRTVCNRCQTPRSGGDKPKPKEGTDLRGPPGLFQSGDWTCNTCGNINWERRSECNMCKSSKPGMAGLDEKRDGAGGGFNERQQRVASAKTEVGEDGYDDFGVKKKKVKASKAEREAAALARLQQSYSAIYQPPQSATDSSATLSLSESGKVSDKSVAPAAFPTLRNNIDKRRSRSPISTSKVDNLSKSRDRSRERRRHSPSRMKRDRRERSPPGRGRDSRRRSRSRGCSNDRKRDHSRRDRHYR